MKNYQHIRDVCDHTSELSASVIDDFLLYFAAEQHNPDREADKRMAAYRHIARDLPEEWLNRYKAQYVAHKIFKKKGLIRKYINHSGLRHFTEEEMDFLRFQKDHPWQFSFAEITGRPEEDFFEMYDVFTGGDYLLFSPSMTTILQTQQPRLWFNMVSFNGECMQTYGPVGFYNGFEPEDIFFFATELNRGRWFEDGHELMEDVEQNPIPYAMLITGTTLPLVAHGDDQVVQITAEYLDDAFNTADFSDDFKVEYSGGVYRLSLNGWNDHPHFSSAYYDEKEQLLFLYSMTDRGFRELVDQLNHIGYNLSYEPDRRVNMPMVTTAGKILKKEYKLNPYEEMFSEEKSDEENRELNNINAMLAALIPYVNSGEKPDFDVLAAKYGTDPETARELYEKARKMVE